MSASWVVRMAVATDVPDIARLSRDRIEQGLGWSWTPARVQRSLCDPQTNVIVAASDLAMHGFGIMKYRDEDAHLLLLAVRPSSCRCGVGGAVLTWLEQVAQAFYARLGYRAAQVLPGYYQGVEAGVRLAKDLHRVQVGPA